MRLWNKLAARRGETLTETLVAVLVVALSSAVLAAMLGAASRMNALAIRQDDALFSAVTAAETGTKTGDETVEVTVNGAPGPLEFSVALCGDAEGLLRSYRYEKG